jgi:hypothetical protein
MPITRFSECADMTADDVRKLLKTACDKAGSLRAWARENHLSAAYVSDVLLGNRQPGPTICEALGIEAVKPVTAYRKTK